VNSILIIMWMTWKFRCQSQLLLWNVNKLTHCLFTPNCLGTLVDRYSRNHIEKQCPIDPNYSWHVAGTQRIAICIFILTCSTCLVVCLAPLCQVANTVYLLTLARCPWASTTRPLDRLHQSFWDVSSKIWSILFIEVLLMPHIWSRI
jgi:hypothetical protein